MPKIAYQDFNFRYSTVELIKHVNTIISESYELDGLRLTLRQIYYQVIARDLLDDSRWYFWNGSKWVADPEHKNPKSTKNNVPNYNWLGNTVNDARLAGLIDWMAIEDLTRNLISVSHKDSPDSALHKLSDNYWISKWEDQDTIPEVWIEKQALQRVFENICFKFDVPLLPCRGYMSQSEMWESAMRYVELLKVGKRVCILHFGDHDPSGMDMTRDIEERLRMFVSFHVGYSKALNLSIKRIALNMDQVEKYNPPENPAKTTDRRFAKYQEEFGDSSWELDALNPRVLLDLVRTEINAFRDMKKWNEKVEREADERGILKVAANDWLAEGGIYDHIHSSFGKELKAEVAKQKKLIQGIEK